MKHKIYEKTVRRIKGFGGEVDINSQLFSGGLSEASKDGFKTGNKGSEGTESFEEGVRSKTSMRIFYEAQVAVIKKQLGDLEKIRTDLGLSQRKICQLLMVDPSAWTRWNRPDEEAPPHVWRALQWYMVLQEKIPGLTPQYFIGKDPQILHEKALLKINEEKAQREALEMEMRSLKEAFQTQEQKLIKSLRFYRIFSSILGLLALFLGLR